MESVHVSESSSGVVCCCDYSPAIFLKPVDDLIMPAHCAVRSHFSQYVIFGSFSTK